MSSRDAARSLGEMAGVAFLLIAPVVIGYWWSRRLTAKRDGYDPVRWPIVTGFLVSILFLAGQCATPRSTDPRRAVPAAADDKHVIEVIDSRASDPLPPEIAPENLETMRRAMDEQIAKTYGHQLGSVASKISTENLGAGTVIHYDARASKGSRLFQYIGVQAGMLKVVSCVSEDGIEFPACRERAVNLFGKPSADATQGSQHG